MDYDDIDMMGVDDFEDEFFEAGMELINDDIDDNFINTHIQEVSPVDEGIKESENGVEEKLSKKVLEQQDIDLSKGIPITEIDLSSFGIQL